MPIHCKWKYVDRQKVIVYGLSFVVMHTEESFE